MTFAVAEVRVNINSLVIREDLDSKGRRYLPQPKIPFKGLGYNEYVTQKKLRTNENDNIDKMKEDLDNLKNEIGEIKSLLKELVNG